MLIACNRKKRVSSCATDTARLWRQASTRSTLLIPFNWILFIDCFCFMGGGWGRETQCINKCSEGSGFRHRDHFMRLFFSCSLCCYLSLIFIAQQWLTKVWDLKGEVGLVFVFCFFGDLVMSYHIYEENYFPIGTRVLFPPKFRIQSPFCRGVS